MSDEDAALPWTRCTICAAPTPGDDDANEAFCFWCLAHQVCPPQDPEAQRLALEIERRLSVTRLAQTLGRN